MQVLVVEDDDALRKLIIELVELYGYKAVGVENGQAALDYLATHTPAMILLDLWMPVMCGNRFLEHRQTQERLLSIPVVVVSATPHSLKYEVEGIVCKPFKQADLMPHLLKFCGARQRAA